MKSNHNDTCYRGKTDWMSAVGAGLDSANFINLDQAHREVCLNKA